MKPIWKDKESDAIPVVPDNPTNGPTWPNDQPSVGNVSVALWKGTWFMTYDGGRNWDYRDNLPISQFYDIERYRPKYENFELKPLFIMTSEL